MFIHQLASAKHIRAVLHLRVSMSGYRYVCSLNKEPLEQGRVGLVGMRYQCTRHEH